MSPAATFSALGDSNRLRILTLIGDSAGPTATDLAGSVGISRPAVIKHIRVLEGAGLVDREKQGRDVRFTVNAAGLHQAGSWLDRRAVEWDRRLQNLKRAAEAEDVS